MSDVGSFIIGTVAVAGGFLLEGASFGLASPLAGALIAFGVGELVQGVVGSPRPSNEGIQSNVGSADASLIVIYGGPVRVGGKVSETWVQVPSTDYENLIRAVDFCVGSEDGSGIEDITNIYFDDVLAVSPPTLDSAGTITTGIQTFFDGFFSYACYRGQDTQAVNTTLAGIDATRYPSTWKHAGLAYFVAGLKKDQEKFPGIPNITADIKGNRVYDPRTSTWGWSNNPALCLLDFLTSKRYGAALFYPERDGGDTNFSEIDEQSFIDAANYCEMSVQDGSGGTQQRFTFDGWLDTANSLDENVGAILASMRGDLVFQNGKFRLLIHQPGSSVMTLDETNIVGDWSFMVGGTDKAPNHVIARYPGGTNGTATEDIEWPEYGDTTFLDEDAGHDQTLHVDLVGVQDPVRAQQIAMVLLKEARQNVAVQVRCQPEAVQLEVGDIVTIDHQTPGWTGATAKDFWVAAIELMLDETVRLTLSEYDANVYSLDTQTRPTDPPGTSLPDPTTTDAPTNLVLTSDSTTQQVTPAGDKIPRILATWTLPVNKGIDRVVVVERKSGSSQWNPARVLSPSDDQQALFEPKGGVVGDTWEVGVYVLVGQRLLKSAITTNTVVLATDFVASDIIGTIVEVDASESDYNSDGVVEGRLSVTIIGSGTYDLQFMTRQGPGTSWTTPALITGLTSASATQTQDVALLEKANCFIAFDLFISGTSTQVGHRVIVTYDPDSTANILQLSAWVLDDGTPGADVQGDSDTAKVYLTATTDGTEPADPTSATADATIAARSGTATFSSMSVAAGGVLRVKARGENAAGQIAPVATIKTSRVVRPTSGGTGTLAPSVQAVPSQSGGVGTITLTIDDPDTVVTGVFFAQKTDSGGYGTFVEDTAAPYESSVTLDPKHNVGIAWRVDYTINSQNFSVGGSYSFDADVTPEVQIASVSRDTDGTVLIGLHGDEDAVDVYATWNIGSAPTAPADPTTADTALGAATGILDTAVVANPGDFAYVKAAAKDASGNLGPVVSAFMAVSPGYIVPTVQETPSQSGTTGTITLSVNDPQSHVTGVYFAQKTDSGGFGSFALDSTPPYASSVTLDPKHPVAIAWRVDYDDIDGSSKSIGGSFSFDIDTTANVHVSATIDDSGNCIIDVVGDEDTVGSYATAAVGTNPSDPTTGVFDLHITSRSGSGTVLTGVNPGETVHVKVKGYNGSSLGPTATAKATRDPLPDGNSDQKPTVEFSRTASGTTSETFTITATAGAGSPSPVLQVRYRSRISNSAYSAWSAWATSPQTGVVIPRDYFYDTVVEAQSRDTSISNYVSAAGYVTVVGQMEALDPGSGKLDPGAPVYGGGGVFVKSAETDPDDLSSVPDVSGTAGRYAPERMWKYIGASDTWVLVGTVHFGRYGGVIKLEHVSGRGSGSGNLSTSRAEIVVRCGNGTAAPNLQGAWSVETGSTPANGPTITDLKVVGASSGTGNMTFDVYAKVRGYSGGSWVLVAQTDDGTWTFDGTSSTDPGAASSTIFVGDVKHQFTHEGNIVSGMEVDSGAANNAPVGGVVSSSSTPTGAYPDGTIWAVI